MRILPACVLFALLIFSIPFFTVAQDKPVQIPPSPDAGHLGTYGEFQVNKTTGSAEISVPIINLQEGGITVSVNLSYQSAGLRPADRPSWVGMGWILSGGGMISRTMRGRWDDMGNGFLQNLMAIPPAEKVHTTLLLPPSDLRTEAYMLLKSMTDHQHIDYEPDAFSFNFGNYGGGFFFGNDGNVHCVEHAGLKFEPIFGTVEDVAAQNIIVGWRAVDENGLVYKFDALEFTDTRNGDVIVGSYISSWYLTSIYNHATKTTATFTYSSAPYTVEYHDKSHTYTYDRTNIHWSAPTITASTQETRHEAIKFLSSISLNDHTVQFFTSDTPEPWKQLDEVRWTHSGSLKKFLFDYDYFGTPCAYPQTGCERAKLLSVTEYHPTDPKVYAFEYYPGTVPSIRTNAQDHWGFFNGQSNSTLVPSVPYLDIYLGGGANRTPSFSHTLIGMLKKITYPTKGSTTFTYGQNTWEDEATEADVTVRTEVTGLLAQNGTNSSPNCDTRTVNATDPDLEYTLEFTYDPEFLNGAPDPHFYPYMKIFEVGNATPIVHHIMEWSNPNPTPDDIELDAGESYLIEVCAFASQKARVTDIFLTKVDPDEIGEPIARTTGGLRLSKIENTEPETGAVYTRTFDYGFGGYLVNPSLASGVPTYASQSVSEILGEDDIWHTTYTMRISSHPVLGLGSNSVPVAYENVTEYSGTPALHVGRIETVFMKQQDQAGGLMPQISRHTTRSKVKIQREYDQAGTLVKKDDYVYNILSVGTVRGFRAKRLKTTLPYDYDSDFSFANYNLFSSWFQVRSHKTTLYSANGTLEQTTLYEYDTTLMHTKPMKETIVNSSGEEIHKTSLFPSDKTECEKECYKYYHEDLSSCNGLTNIFAKEAAVCRSEWDGCMITFRICMEQAYKDSENKSYCDGCTECVEELEVCIDNSDYYPCLTGLGEHYEFEICQKEAFINYMLCQSGFGNCVRDEFVNSIHDPEKANAALILSNQLGVPVELKTFNGETELSKTAYEFKLWNDTVPLPKSVSVSYLAGAAVPQFTIMSYDAKGNPTELVMHTEGFSKAYLWGYDSTYLIAEFVNASVAETGHSSFESTSNEGNLSFQLASSSGGKTGAKSHALHTKPITKTGLTSAKRYKVSYWAKSGVPAVNGVVSGSEHGPEPDGWKYYEKIVTGITTLTISGTGTTLIDDLRVGPEHSVVTTFVHQPGIGIISKTDPNHLTTYYAYDTFGRLITVKDHYYNLIRLLKYNYKD